MRPKIVNAELFYQMDKSNESVLGYEVLRVRSFLHYDSAIAQALIRDPHIMPKSHSLKEAPSQTQT
jgi:hypothetical protein